MTPPPPAVLELSGITKRFGEVAANRAIDWSLDAGRIYALLGENGAGKSTLMSILAGRYQPDAGTIRRQGRTVHFQSPAQALAAGIGMVYQRFMLVAPLSVAENIRLHGPAGRSRGDRKDVSIRALAARYGLAVDPDALVQDLSMGERQRVEILKLLTRRAEVLIFDEPTAVLTHAEIDGLFEVFQRLRDEGKTIVFITHKLEEVMTVADEIAVMRRGRMVARLAAADVRSQHDLARLMVGREIILNVDKPPAALGETILSVSGLSGPAGNIRPRFEAIDFKVRRGEILAIVGVAGNGQEDLVAGLAGLAPLQAGRLTFKGRPFSAPQWGRKPRDGLAYIPADRDHTASVGALSLVENFMLTRLAIFSRALRVDRRRAAEATAAAVERFAIRGSGLKGTAGHLSGGNLQKLILARELSRRPDLLLAEQPTQGLDVRATEAVWQALLRTRETSAVLLITGDLKEALSLADRIAVIFRGRILDTIAARDDAAIDRIKLLMAGLEIG
jgi:simple sugar transport system ATP-binding protein